VKCLSDDQHFACLSFQEDDDDCFSGLGSSASTSYMTPVRDCFVFKCLFFLKMSLFWSLQLYLYIDLQGLRVTPTRMRGPTMTFVNKPESESK